MKQRGERMVDPASLTDRHIERRHGVKSRKELTQDQERAERHGSPQTIVVGNGTVVLGPHIRQVNFTGAGVTVTVVGDTATIDIP